MTRPLSAEQKARNRAGAAAARKAIAEARARHADAALIRTVGVVEAILLAPTLTDVTRRASVALGTWDEHGRRIGHADPSEVEAALASWLDLRDDAVAS